MPKVKNPSGKPPARSEKKPPKNRSKKAQAAESGDDSGSSDVEPAVESGKPQRQLVNWVKNPHWTHTLIAHLCAHPDIRRKLFSDSTADAKKEQRKKDVSKDGKAVQYGALAKAIFEDDPNEQARYANDPGKLKGEYRKHLDTIGATGAGLDPSEIQAGSKLASLIDHIRKDWPWWDDLHSFWRELPSYNPIGVQSSEHGTDHASAAADLFQPAASSEVDDGPPDDDDDGRSETSKARHAQEHEDTGGDDKSYSSSSDHDDDDDVVEISAPASRHSALPSPSPPPTAKKPTPKASKGKGKALPTRSGRDFGIAKANATKSSSAARKKPQNAIDRLNDIRESESLRLAEKRQLQHEEEMERLKIKRKKYELKVLQAENERLRLSRRATSQSPRQLSRRVLNLGSPSPSKSRSSRYTAESPRSGFRMPDSPSPAKSRRRTLDFSPSKSRSSRYAAESPRHANAAGTSSGTANHADTSLVDISFNLDSTDAITNLDFSSFASTSSDPPIWYLPPASK
ncbi:hypothetical protein MVEN_01146200 [Mycena venus]|uniref:Uncharacterized protein n=1 Tax=Mycena venus TaxID=2733690 RepID=A0A8H7CVI2_9AGAR|nr:hypothetical protein MVEN_01146200 [Mycena venus]